MRPTDYVSDHAPPTTERDTIVVEDEVMREGFTQVPNLLLRRIDISHGAKIAYAMLLSYAWGTERCFPGQARLAADLGVERKAVIRYLQELRDKRLITVTRRGMGKTNVYKLPRLTDVPILGHQEVPPVGHPEVPSMGQKQYSEKNIQKDESLSRFDRSHDQFSEPRNETRATFRRPTTGASSRASRSGDPIQFSAVGEIIKQRESLPIRADVPRPKATGSRLGPATYGTTEEREKLYAYLRDFSVELGDEAQLSSSITQVLKIFHSVHIPMEHWDDHLYRARALTQEHSASIKKRSVDPTKMSGKNKFPYFKKVLVSLVSPEKQERAN